MATGTKQWATVALVVGGVGVAALAFFGSRRAPEPEAAPAELPSAPLASEKSTSAAQATYVGTSTCTGCHAEVAARYQGSDHDRAIEIPSPSSVLAPFANESISHDGVKTTFLRQGDQYVVRTRGPDGKPADFRVAYTFGVRPLQQYLLDLGGGRLQALTVAWDSRPKAEGGQRWFDLYPSEEHSPESELHWTRPAQNWNFACADCHTTALQKNYDPATKRFSPQFAELDVSCEACHGPGSNHLAWAQAPGTAAANHGFSVSLQRATDWTIAPGARTATPHAPGPNQVELEVCAPCHSRREQLREGLRPGEPFLDAYRPELLAQAFYHADGQVAAEDYAYGSFLQSRMFHAGVRCSDCHEPHSLELRHAGNALCAGCHSPEVFDTRAHHHHENVGSACVDCHMPATTYMQVDSRRDHFIRIPRPDIAMKVGAPDACTECHDEETQAWAAERISDWFGPTRASGGDLGQRARVARFASTLAAARNGEPESLAALGALAQNAAAPVIVRGTALAELARFSGDEARGALLAARSSQEPLLRLGVAQGASGLAPADRIEVLRPLLGDPLLAIRTEATRSVVGLPPELVNSARATLEPAYRELLATEKLNADRPEGQLRIARVHESLGDRPAATAALEEALRLDPRFVPALVNLADVRRAAGDDAEGELLLRRALGIDPSSAEAWHALGLSLVRQKHLDEALVMLGRAAKLRPENPRFAYVYAVALADGGKLEAALAALRSGLRRHPGDRALLQALLGYARQAGDRELASRAAAALAGAAPFED